MVNLVEEGVDLALRIGHLEDSSLIARKAGETRRVLVASPRYLERRGTPRTPAELTAHSTIQFLSLTSTREWTFLDAARGGGELRVAAAPHYVTNSADAALWHAEHDGGLTLALSYQVVDAVRAGRLCIVLADYEPAPLPIQWVYPDSRLLSAKVRAFIEHAVRSGDWRFGDVTTAAGVPPGSSRT
jgi:DNA-binding transcriptional LysR family regulator